MFLKTQNSIGTVTLCNLPHNDFLLKFQLHDKGFYTVQHFCSLSHNRLEVENRLGIIFLTTDLYLAAQQKYCKTSCKGQWICLHFAMSAKCVASLRQSLQKVEPDSTLCNASYMTLLITLCDFMMARHILPLTICL